MFRVLCFTAFLSIVSIPPIHADDGFEARYEFAKKHAKVLMERAPMQPLSEQWSTLDKTLDGLRARCGKIVDRRREDIIAILLDWFHAEFEQNWNSFARTLAEQFSFEELNSFSFVDPTSPSMLDLFGHKRIDAFLVRYNERVDRQIEENFVFRQRIVPQLRVIDECLHDNAASFTRS